MPLTHLGNLPIKDFLRDYWQQKPLLIRNAFPDFESPLDGDELAGLALEEAVESRLVLEKGSSPWELRTGPFDEETFAQLPESHWTLLVQAVDQWVPEVQELLQCFRFLPDWRLDDIMVSYAADQGSVGPHFDYYDVFLLQGSGKRRWRLGQECDSQSPRIEGTPLNILQDFDATEDWVLEPGDMLYIPPGWAHWGTAEGDDCITYSIGFRAPSQAEVVTDVAQEIASQLTNDQRYRDPDPAPASNPGAIPPAAIERLREMVLEHLTEENLAQWFGHYMTEPKYPDLEPETPEETIDWREPGGTLYRHPASRFAYYHREGKPSLLFVDGEHFECAPALAERLCERLEVESGALLAVADEEGLALIDELVAEGKLWVVGLDDVGR
ncbi:ribosomal protein uL16 3-hydroxylase [Marinimicrobium sp. C2-29]|uniref:ribosomal protein uL16 3-hydroxylase n=1 Tax=Marinimicrobium sp. C2-29 TaxID=3139825 RepID=UPI00313A2EEE